MNPEVAPVPVSVIEALRADAHCDPALLRRSDAPGKDAAPVPYSVIEALRAQVRAIEQPVLSLAPGRIDPLPRHELWTLGSPDLPPSMARPLAPYGVHEIKPQPTPGTSAAAGRALVLGFALRLAVRRLKALRALEAPIVWCAASVEANETGHLYVPGLLALGLDPANLLKVEPARASETLWALEEALKSGACALVIGSLDTLDLTAARRLALAAQSTQTPCLLLTHGASQAAGATASRWRVGLAPSRPHPMDQRAPGGFAVTLTIERCRGNPALSLSPCVLEWSHETHRFRVPAPLAHRAPRDPAMAEPGVESSLNRRSDAPARRAPRDPWQLAG